MKIVHITPHLGGGVGKAHASLCAASPTDCEHHYVLLEEARDHRYVDQIRETGARVTLGETPQQLHDLMAGADIVQFEWWNHPLMCGLLAGPPLPAMRSVFWSHVSGVCAPFIPAALIEAADRFVFTSACSKLAPNLSGPDVDCLGRTDVINSGFCHPETVTDGAFESGKGGISYLGTVDFTKMSPAMMQVIDRLETDNVALDVWGGVHDNSPVHMEIAAMKHPERFRLRGHSADPAGALSRTSVFMYLLQPFHFGTAENALIEAMSLGCAPLVFANPCEQAIVRDGETGLVASSVDHAVELLGWMLDNPDEVSRIGANARTEICALKTPERSIAAFQALWIEAMQKPKRTPDFAPALGATPRDWYDTLNGGKQAAAANTSKASQTASKGSLAHFKVYYTDLDRPQRRPIEPIK
ncbi:glycosyltransferase [uncultured Hoeflea sp.]|uniref:glycosyltransferase n=1 Tax=uncultured Hoeflea sp. TaxID=538666 RepID=UPI0030DB07B9